MTHTVLSLWHGRLPIVPGARVGQTMRDIAAEVATHHGITVEALKGPAQHRRIVRLRQEVMFRAYEERWADGRRVYSLPQIGAFLNRDHSTVIHGIRAHERRLGQNTETV